MARIRSIKPEFPQSETIGKLSRDARLLFIQLWTIVDDSGRARAASRMLASLLYPYDDDAPKLIGKWLNELEAKGCIRQYEVEGNKYLDISNWLKHQKIDRPSPSRLPEYREASTNPREESRALDADLGPRILDLGSRTLDHIGAVADATRPPIEEEFEKFWKSYPKREGANPKAPARKSFFAAVKSGADPPAITAGAAAYAADPSTKIGTSYVAQAVTWLNQKRWEDHVQTGGNVDSEELERHRRECLKRAEVSEEVRRHTGMGSGGADFVAELRPPGGVVRGESEAMGGQLAVSIARSGYAGNG